MQYGRKQDTRSTWLNWATRPLTRCPWVGFGSAKVLEVIIDDHGDTFRTVYTVKFKRAVYVLHAFQKKAKKGIATPQHELDKIKRRLKTAEDHYRRNYEQTFHKDATHEREA